MTDLSKVLQMNCSDSLAIRGSNGLRMYGCFEEGPDINTGSHNVSATLYRRANTTFKIQMNTYGEKEIGKRS